MEDRFGIPAALFDDYLIFKRKDRWIILKKAASQSGYTCRLKISKVGLKAFQKIGAYIKPTTRMIQIFGNAATRAKVEINEGQLQHILAGGKISIDLDLGTGYVILTLGRNQILGLGLYLNGKISSQIPRKELRPAMLHRVAS